MGRQADVTHSLPAATGARGQLLTLLGEFVLPSGGSAWTTTLVAALGSLGVEEGTTRQVLARSAARGWLTPEKRGRRTCWHLTAHARHVLDEGTKRIYGLGHSHAGWDGQWVLVLASVPERQRALRHQLRARLTWAGFGALGQGAWLSPYPERETEAVEVVKDLGLEAVASFVGSLGRLGSAHALVAQAWNLPDLGRRYGEFVDWATTLAPGRDEDRFVARARLVHEWRRFPHLDPELPPQLLPGAWNGAVAARLFHQLHARWEAGSARWWHTLAQSTPG